MDDLRQRFATLDRVPAPDIWSEVERRLELLGAGTPTRRLAVARPEWRGDRAARSGRRSAPGQGRRTTLLLAVVAVTAVAVVGGAVAVGSGLVRLGSIVPPPRDGSPGTSPAPSPAPSTASPEPPATATPPIAAPARPGMFAALQDWRPVSDTVGWVAAGAAIVRTADRGATWADVTPPGWATTSASAFIDADTVYLASGGSTATIAATHDRGTSWVTVDLDVGPVSGGPVFSFQTASAGFATFTDSAGGASLLVYGTTDGGRTWSGPKDGAVPPLGASFDKLGSPLGGLFSQRAGKFDNKPFDNRFFLSADGATTWTGTRFPVDEVSPADALKEILDLVRDDAGRVTMAIRVDGPGSIGGAVYESSPDLADWRLVRAVDGDSDVRLLSPTTWIVTDGFRVRSTIDAGAHWRTTTTPTRFRDTPRFATPDHGWFHGICFANPSLPTEPLCDGGTVLAITGDGGATWTRLGP